MKISDKDLREDFIIKHLPYRLNVLMSHDISTHPSSNPILENENLIIESSLEASIVFGRLLMQFLGLMKYANKTVAHCTSIFPEPIEQELFKIAKKAIYELVTTHIIEIDKSIHAWDKHK